MLAVLGKRYVVDAVADFWRQEQESKAAITYLTDAIQAIAENTAKAAGGGTAMSRRFYEILHPVRQRPAEEILAEVIERGGLEVTA